MKTSEKFFTKIVSDMPRQPLLDDVDIFAFLRTILEALEMFGLCGQGTEAEKMRSTARSIVNGKRSSSRRKRRRAEWRRNRLYRVARREAGSTKTLRAMGGWDLIDSVILNTAETDVTTLTEVLEER
jgi:hypothetical protein